MGVAIHPLQNEVPYANMIMAYFMEKEYAE